MPLRPAINQLCRGGPLWPPRELQGRCTRMCATEHQAVSSAFPENLQERRGEAPLRPRTSACRMTMPLHVSVLASSARLVWSRRMRFGGRSNAASGADPRRCFSRCHRSLPRDAMRRGHGVPCPYRDGQVVKAKPARWAIGLDVGATKLAGGLVNSLGEVAFRERLPTPSGREAIMQGLMRLCSRLLEKAKGRGIEPASIGVATAGQVDVATGRIVSVTSNIPGWGGSAVGDELQKRFGLPVLVENDGNAFALGEALFGAGKAAPPCEAGLRSSLRPPLADFGGAGSLRSRGCGCVVGIVVGTGIGGGVVVNGKPVRGAHFWAGSVGHICLAARGRLCTCGARGCLEAYSGGWAIAARYRELTGASLTSQEVARRASSGDQIALAVLREAGRHLGRGIAIVGNLLDPDCLVLGGPVIRSHPIFLESCAKALRAATSRAADFSESVRQSELGDDAVFIGSAAASLLSKG